MVVSGIAGGGVPNKMLMLSILVELRLSRQVVGRPCAVLISSSSSLHARIDKRLELRRKLRNLGHELLNGLMLFSILLGHVFKLHPKCLCFGIRELFLISPWRLDLHLVFPFGSFAMWRRYDFCISGLQLHALLCKLSTSTTLRTPGGEFNNAGFRHGGVQYHFGFTGSLNTERASLVSKVDRELPNTGFHQPIEQAKCSRLLSIACHSSEWKHSILIA